MWEITHLGGEEEDCGSAKGGDAGVAKEWREGECEGEGCEGEEDEKSHDESLYIFSRERRSGVWYVRVAARGACGLRVGVRHTRSEWV